MMTSFRPNPSWFHLPADCHDHCRHISSAIHSAASSHDISLVTSDGSVISTSKILLCLSSSFLSRLLSSTPTPPCMPTCIILPDCSTSSLSDLISLLGGGVGTSQFDRSNYVHAASEVIDAANLLGIMLGTLVDEAVGFREGGISIPEILDQQINATNVEENNFGVEPLQMVQFSQAALERELLSLQDFGENNWDKPTRQNESNVLVTTSNVELVRVMPPKNNVLTDPVTQEGSETQCKNDEPTKIIKVTSKNIQHENTRDIQNTDVLDGKIDKDNVLKNCDSEPSESFGCSQPIERNDTEPSYNEQIQKNKSDNYDILSDCFGENHLPNMLLKKEFVVTVNANDVRRDENQNQEHAIMKQHNVTMNHDSIDSIEMTQHDTVETTVNSEQGSDAFDETTKINLCDTDKTTKDSKNGSNVCEESETIKPYDGTSEIMGFESENKKKDIRDICKTSFFQCDICDQIFVSRELLRKHGLGHLINQETIVRVKYDSGTDDYVCKDVNMNVPTNNDIKTNHSAHEAEKADLIEESAIKFRKVRSASKRSRSFNENVAEGIKNAKKRKTSTSRKELLTKKIDAEDHSHYGARKNPCKKCSNCIQKDCGKCIYCKDKPKFGGPNKRKQKCAQKLKCSQPVIVCLICETMRNEKAKLNIPQKQTIQPQTVGRRGMPCGYKHLF